MASAALPCDELWGNREAIVDRWRTMALAVYPERATAFIQSEQDRFHNPVGHVLGEGLAVLFDGLVAGGPEPRMRRALEDIVRIRAVQQLSPSEAIGFVYMLEPAIREVLGTATAVPDDTLLKLHEGIDRLALEAFDLFVRCREELYELRLREIRDRRLTLRERVRSRAEDRGGKARGDAG